MAITWTPITDAIEASIATEVATKITAACTALKTALDVFWSVFTGTPDDDSAEIAIFFSNLVSFATDESRVPILADVVGSVTDEMEAWVLEAHEALVVASTATEILAEVIPQPHEPLLPHLPE